MVGLNKKRGFWNDKRGLPAGCEHNRPVHEGACEALHKKLVEMFGLLVEIDAAIDQAGDVLRVSQPARMSGKYGLRWWITKSGSAYREPVVVRWMLQKNGVMTPKRAVVMKARVNGSFAINAIETQECLNILTGLIKRRGGLKKRIAALEKSLRHTGGVSYYLNNERERLEVLKAGVVSNLLAHNYEVEASLLPASEEDT